MAPLGSCSHLSLTTGGRPLPHGQPPRPQAWGGRHSPEGSNEGQTESSQHPPHKGSLLSLWPKAHETPVSCNRKPHGRNVNSQLASGETPPWTVTTDSRGAHFLPEPGSFSLPSLAWKEGPVGAASLRLASHSCRAGPGLDFLTRSLPSPQGFYSWFFNTVTMK